MSRDNDPAARVRGIAVKSRGKGVTGQSQLHAAECADGKRTPQILRGPTNGNVVTLTLEFPSHLLQGPSRLAGIACCSRENRDLLVDVGPARELVGALNTRTRCAIRNSTRPKHADIEIESVLNRKP